MSYSHSDKPLVYPEIERLYWLGYRIWFDQGIRPSSEWSEEVATKLKRCSLLLVFLSPHAITSRHVLNEIHFGLEHAKPFLAVHLSEFSLPDSLQLQVGRIQGVLKYSMTEERYHQQLNEWLPQYLKGAIPPEVAASTSAEPVRPTPPAVPYLHGKVVEVPSFHYGSVVPPDYFIDREEELEEASRLIRAGQGLLRR